MDLEDRVEAMEELESVVDNDDSAVTADDENPATTQRIIQFYNHT